MIDTGMSHIGFRCVIRSPDASRDFAGYTTLFTPLERLSSS
jgi:hypothetical protein